MNTHLVPARNQNTCHQCQAWVKLQLALCLLLLTILQLYHFPPPLRKSVLNIHWKDWCWSWNSNTLATWCEELTHLKRPWCWERLKVGGKGDDRGWDGFWMASPTQWAWVWVNSESWWGTGRPGVLQSMGSQRVGYNWATEVNSLLQSLALFACSLDARPYMPAVVLYYCTFQGILL